MRAVREGKVASTRLLNKARCGCGNRLLPHEFELVPTNYKKVNTILLSMKYAYKYRSSTETISHMEFFCRGLTVRKDAEARTNFWLALKYSEPRLR